MAAACIGAHHFWVIGHMNHEKNKKWRRQTKNNGRVIKYLDWMKTE